MPKKLRNLLFDTALDVSGLFWPVGSTESKFAVEVKYRFGAPIEVSYIISGEIPLSGAIDLHGVLNNGEKCSLVAVGFPNNGRTVQGCGTVFCDYLFLGQHTKAEVKYKKWCFRFTGMMELFYPNVSAFRIKAPLDERKVDFTAGSFKYHSSIDYTLDLMGGLDVYGQTTSSDTEALAELSNCIEKINEKSNDELSLIHNKALSIVVQCDEGRTISEVQESLDIITNLFTVFLRKPVRLEFVNICAEGKRCLKCLPSQYAPIQMLEQAMGAVGFGPSPICIDTIDFEQALTVWESEQQRFDLTVMPIRNNIGITDLSGIYGEFILAAVILESIAKEDGANGPAQKFSYPIEEYCCQFLLDELKKISADLGVENYTKLIHDLRNEIAHPKRKRVLLKRTTRKELLRILLVMQLVAASRLLDVVGVDRKVVYRYQRYHGYVP